MTGWPRGRSRDGGIDEITLPGGSGRLWLCGKHAIGPDPEAALARVGATTAVCLTQRAELAERYPAYVAWLDAEAGGRSVWFPVEDLHAPSLAAAVPFLAGLRARLARGEGLLVHCGAGFGRAGTVACCLLVADGLAPEEAIAQVAAERPMAGPEAGAQSELIEAYAEHVAQG